MDRLEEPATGIVCDTCTKREVYLSWLYICEYCLGHFCGKHQTRENHRCKGTYNIVDVDINPM